MAIQGLNPGVEISHQAYRAIPWIVAIAFFMQMLDSSVLNTALPAMAVSLKADPLRMHWAVIAYMLTVAVLLPICGWLCDRYGARRLMFCSIGLFTLGSLFCSLAASVNQLILARIVQGAGGAFMFPVGRLVILRVYPRHLYVRVLSAVSLPGLAGQLLGPTVGGFLAEFATWRWIFLINLPMGLLGMLAVWRLLPELRTRTGNLDWIGYLLIAASMLLLSFALDGIGHASLRLWLAMMLVCAGGGSLALYWLYAKRAREQDKQPLFCLDIFGNRCFSVGILGNIFARLACGGMPFLTPLLLQLGLGYSPSRAGLLMLPLAAASMAVKPLATRLLGSLGHRPVLTGNTLILGLCIIAFALINQTTPLWLIIVLFSLFGAANSLQFTAMNTLAMIDLAPEWLSAGNSMISLVMQLSMSMGVAAAASLLSLYSRETSELIPAFQSVFVSLGLFSVVAAAIFLFTPKGAGLTQD